MLKNSKGHLFHLEIQKAEDFPPGIEYHVAECKASPDTDSDQEIPLFSNFQCAQDGFVRRIFRHKNVMQHMHHRL